MIERRLRAVVEGLAADEAQSCARGRDAEGEDVTLLTLANAGLRIDQELVGGRSVGRQHLGAADDQAVLGLVNHAEMNERMLLLVRSLRAVALRIDDGVGEKQVAAAAVLVVISNIVRVAFAALAEEFRAFGPAHQHGVEIVGRAADHSEGGIGPNPDRLPPLHQVGMATRDHERRSRRPRGSSPRGARL